MVDRCRWVYDKDVPGGKFLVPGCMNRANGGDDYDCHCPEDPETVEDRIEAMRHELAGVRAEIAALRKWGRNG